MRARFHQIVFGLCVFLTSSTCVENVCPRFQAYYFPPDEIHHWYKLDEPYIRSKSFNVTSLLSDTKESIETLLEEAPPWEHSFKAEDEIRLIFDFDDRTYYVGAYGEVYSDKRTFLLSKEDTIRLYRELIGFRIPRKPGPAFEKIIQNRRIR